MKASPTDQKELLRLQDVDTRISRLEHQLAHLPQDAAIAQLASQDDAVRRRQVIASGALDDTRAELSRLESDVAVVEARMARDSERMQHTSSVKDIEALESELASLRKRRGDLEDIELTVMERLELQEGEVAGIDGERAVLADDASVLEQERERARVAIRADADAAARDRTAIAGGIDGELIALYEKRRAVGGGVGAALLRARTCGGCTISLTGVDLEAVRTAAADEVLFCPDCGRILVRTEESGV